MLALTAAVLLTMVVAAARAAEEAAAETPPAAAEWHQWRGPARNGISPESLSVAGWPAAGPRQLWKRSVGVGYSAVSVSGGRVYTMGNEGKQDTVWCLNVEDGEVVWKHSYDCDAGLHPGPRATPTVAGNRAYTMSRDGDVFCFDAASGDVKWSKNIQKELGAKNVRWGLSSSALVEGNRVILAAGTCGVALDCENGKVLWKVDSGGAGYASPIALDVGGRRAVLLMSGSEVVCAAVEDGAVLWRHPWKASFPNNCADPVLAGDRVLLSTAYGKGCALLKMGDGPPKELWKHNGLGSHFSSPVLWRGHFYGFNGDMRGKALLVCLDLERGDTRWSDDIKGSLILADGKLVILAADGELVVAEASAEGFKPLARSKVLGGQCWTAPVLSGGRLYCRNHEGDLVCLDVREASYRPGKAKEPGHEPAMKDDKQRATELKAAIERLRPLHVKLGKPQPGDWLERHKESGQTFDEYLACDPVTPRGKRKVLYIQPLGEFTAAQRAVVTQTADFMSRWFSLEVKVRDDLPLSLIPAKARRVHPQWGMKQILSTFVLDEVLKPRLPDDAAACLAFTPVDLWPGEGWNFVFGQASLRERVGVWSIYRNGDLEGNPAERRLCLLRTIKTAVHETGHMFSMRHCTAYECCMCGSNHREESDRRPLELCPECMAKVCWATQAEPLERYRRLAEFCAAAGLDGERDFYARSIKALGGAESEAASSAGAPTEGAAAGRSPEKPADD